MTMNSESRRQYFDVNKIRDKSRASLFEVLLSHPGKKAIYYETDLAGHLDQLLLESKSVNEVAQSLDEVGVVDMTKLRTNLQDVFLGMSRAADSLLFIIRPNSAIIKIVCKVIQLHSDAGLSCNNHVYFTPFRTILCEELLKDSCTASVTTHDFDGFGLAPVAPDLLALHLPSYFRLTTVEADASVHQVAAHSLVHLQDIYGMIPNIKVFGNDSRKVTQKMMQMRKDANVFNNGKARDANSSSGSSSSSSSSASSTIDTLVM